MYKLLVMNGPNLNLLGRREKGIYGTMTLDKINEAITSEFAGSDVVIDYFQSNVEGELVTKLQETWGTYDGVVINPGAYGHYSIAILDAIRYLEVPVIEVHISNIYSREEYRRKSVISEGCLGVISGLGHYGYILAVKGLLNFLQRDKICRE